MSFSKITIVTVSVISLLALSACAVNTGESPKAKGEKIAVLASTSIWGAVAQAVGGQGVQVNSIITEKTPHLNDNPKIQNLAKTAKVILLNGGKFDDSVGTLFKNPNPKQVILNAAKLSDSDTDSNSTDKQLFYSLKTVKTVATELNNTFSKISPENKAVFEANLQFFNKKLDDLLIDAQNVGHEHPDTVVLDPTGATNPLLKEMKLKNLNEGDAIKMLENIAKKQPKMVILSQDPQNTAITRKFRQAAKEAGLPVVLVYSVLPDGINSYYDFMHNTIEAIHTGVHK